MSLEAQLEAILFAAAKPLTVKQLAEATESEAKEVKRALEELRERLASSGGGTRLVLHGQEAEIVTHADTAEVVRRALAAEAQGEMTRPSLEALAILAYRGPMTRPELEQIRGVQSSLILRNLMLRGLVEMKEDARLGQPIYDVTIDWMKHLGFDRREDLPDYERLHANPTVELALKELEEPEENFAHPSLPV